VDTCGLIIEVVVTALSVVMTRTLDIFSMKNQRSMKMSECKYCGGDCPEQVEEPLDSKSKLYDKIGVPASGSYDNTLPNLIEEIENRAEALRNKKGVQDEGH
jgi:hypothetical protein